MAAQPDQSGSSNPTRLETSEMFVSADQLFDPKNGTNFHGEPLPDWKLLRQCFLEEKRLELDAAKRLVQAARDAFADEPNVLRLQPPCLLVGDIHGQYYDLVQMIDASGGPESHQYLFLGDYVDRGVFGCEVVFLLFAMKVCFPETFWMIRGNHECRLLTGHFNFKLECLKKYKSEELYDSIMEAFDALPLAAVISGGGAPETDYFCVHGGLSPDIKYISDINVINRFQEIPKRGPLCDLTWSDPLEDETGEGLNAEDTQEWFDVKYVENPTRGCGYVFGYSATREFLEINSLATIVRAHDVQKDGYRLHRFCKPEKDRSVPMVVTVFSAPNYCDKYENMAAYMLVDFKSETDMSKGLKMEFVQYRWVSHPFWLPRYQNGFDHTIDILLKHVSSFAKYMFSAKDLPAEEGDDEALPSDSILGDNSKSNPNLHKTIPHRGHRRSSSLKEFSIASLGVPVDANSRSESLSASAPAIETKSGGRATRRRMSIVEHMREIEQQQEEAKRKVEEADKLEQRALETGKVLTVAERVSRLRRSSMRAARKNGMTRSRILLINDKIFLKQMQLYMQNASVPFVKTKWQDRANECMPGSKNDTSQSHSLNGSFEGSPGGGENPGSPSDSEFWNSRRSSNASEETGSVGSI